MYITLKQIELENPGCSGSESDLKNFKIFLLNLFRSCVKKQHRSADNFAHSVGLLLITRRPAVCPSVGPKQALRSSLYIMNG